LGAVKVKKLNIFLIAVALVAGMAGCDGDGYTPPSQNLEIWDWYDLDAVRNNLAGHHILMNDLDSTAPGYEEMASPTANEGRGWQPLGTFTGSFDGQGYEIRDLYINRPNENRTGLFDRVFPRGVIKDVGVVNATVTGEWYVGSLAGENWGTVSNWYSSGNVTGDSCVGGLVGWNRGTVSNCYSSGNVTGDEGIGGLVGCNYGIVSDSYSTGNVTGDENVGGLVGGNPAGTVSNSHSTGSVTGYSSVGGLVGWNEAMNEAIVSNSFWDIETSGQATSDGGIGKTIVEMKNINTFSGARWDIIAVANPGTRKPSHIWNIVNGVTYPFFSWE
jgi:hypothetical protein